MERRECFFDSLFFCVCQMAVGVDAKSELGGIMSIMRPHFAVQVGEMVFDNLNPDGIPFSEWADDIGIYDGIGVNLSEENMTGNRGGCIK